MRNVLRACTCKIYGGSTKAGIIHDTGIRCNAFVGDDHYFLRALNGVVQMADVLNDTATHAAMAKVEQQKRQVFSMYYTGTNTTPPERSIAAVSPAVGAPPPLPHGHSWVSFELQDEALYLRSSCGDGFGSVLPKDTPDLADMTFDMQPAVSGDAGAISLSVWELQGGFPGCTKYGQGERDRLTFLNGLRCHTDGAVCCRVSLLSQRRLGWRHRRLQE